MVAGALVVPARRHDPGVLVAEIAPLRTRNRGLIPRMSLIDWVAKWIFLNEHLAILLPIVVK